MLCCVIAPSNFTYGDEPDPDAIYELTEESQRHEDVPRGKVTTHVWKSSIFENTTREYHVYIPAQYDGIQPACLMVFQDGHAYVGENGQVRAPIVFDNLIHAGQMPVTIGVFINPGHHGEDQPQNRWRASNRSFEYDTLSDQYARFVHDELLPHIIEEHNLKLSTYPADRAICGASSGGICAFTAAWEHPEWFGKVLSHIGSFTNIRGGHVYPALIRKTEPKPIRVFLQDGSNDLDNEHGNWWLSNQQMEAALRFSHYDYKFVAGQGAHNMKHGGAIFPDSLRWLWRDHVIGVSSVEDSVDPGDVYVEKSIECTSDGIAGETFKYRFLAPAKVEEGKKYPLVLFLHGAGERGDDNVRQMVHFLGQMAQPAWRKRFPCYILGPQCRNDQKWVETDWSLPETHTAPEKPSPQMRMVLEILNRTLTEEAVDTNRIYLTGLSMGGYGTWDLAARKPELFAAVAPICGGADNSKVAALKDIPVWVVHGAVDNVVPPQRSRLPVEALRKAGGNPIYTELPEVGHNSWTPAYTDNDGLLPWMFRQSK